VPGLGHVNNEQQENMNQYRSQIFCSLAGHRQAHCDWRQVMIRAEMGENVPSKISMYDTKACEELHSGSDLVGKVDEVVWG
jgi:hypothetical protein